MRPIDLVAALLAGEAIAWLGLVLLYVTEIRLSSEISPAQERTALIVVLPFLAALGITLGAWLSRWGRWPFQVAKFCLVGLLNTLIDLGVLNLLIAFAGATQGVAFSLCKAASFGVAVVNSYSWNRLWTFAPARPLGLGRDGSSSRFLLFLGVTLVGAGLNVTMATLIVSFVNPSDSLTAVRLANLAAGVAVVVSAMWDFLAYRYFLFSLKART